MEIIALVFSGISSIVAIISAISALKAKKEVKEIKKQINLNIQTKQNNGNIVGINNGEINETK